MSSYSTKRCAYEGICPRLISDCPPAGELCFTGVGPKSQFSASLVVPGEESEFTLSYSCGYLDFFLFFMVSVHFETSFLKNKIQN